MTDEVTTLTTGADTVPAAPDTVPTTDTQAPPPNVEPTTEPDHPAASVLDRALACLSGWEHDVADAVRKLIAQAKALL